MSNETLNELRNKLRKNMKTSHIEIMSESDIAHIEEWIPTPSYDLNRIISGDLFSGVPEKSFSLFVGPEASGKSSFMCLCLAKAQKMGYTPIVIDTEGAWTDEFVRRWGLDPENIIYLYSLWINEIEVFLSNILESGQEKFAIVVDSIGGIEKEKVLEDAKGGKVKADQGLLQREIKRMLKLLVHITKKQSSIAFASGHYYGNPSQYGSAEEIGGGKFIKLAPHLIVSLKKSKMIGDDEKSVVGNTIKAITLKNRFHPAFQEAIVEINYTKGINRFAGMTTLATKAGIIENAGSWYKFEDYKVQGTANLEKMLNENKEMGDKLLDSINKYIKNTGYSNINESVKEIEETKEEEMESSTNGQRKNNKTKRVT